MVESNCCGLPLRIVCIAIGDFEIISYLCLVVYVILFNEIAIPIGILIFLINLFIIIPMLFGAVKRRSDFFWPYILTRFICIFASLGGLGICVFVILLVKLSSENGKYNDVHHYMNVSGIYFGSRFLIIFIFNVIPFLFVRRYYRELTKIDYQGLPVRFLDLNNVPEPQ